MTGADDTGHVVDQLSPYLDGDLPDAAAARVRAHLGACAACERAATELQAIVGAARTLERPEPPPTLWPAIEGALARHERGPFGWRLFAFGSLAGGALMLAVLWTGWTGVSLGLGRGRGGASSTATAQGEAPSGGATSVASAASPSAAPSVPADPLLAEAEQEFQRAASAYERSIEKLRMLLVREQSRWSVEERVRYADRLGRLDEAISRSRETARRRPGDTAGNEILFAAYQKKIEFLAAAVHRGAPGLGGQGP